MHNFVQQLITIKFLSISITPGINSRPIRQPLLILPLPPAFTSTFVSGFACSEYFAQVESRHTGSCGSGLFLSAACFQALRFAGFPFLLGLDSIPLYGQTAWRRSIVRSWIVSSKKEMLKSQPSEPQNLTLFGYRVVAHVTSKIQSY